MKRGGIRDTRRQAQLPAQADCRVYGAGHGKPSIEPTDDTFSPPFLAIEQAILNYWRSEPSLTDGQVSLHPGPAGQKPEAVHSDDCWQCMCSGTCDFS